jgi:hypothetical protein
MVAKERSEKRERMNEDRKTQLVNLKRGRRWSWQQIHKITPKIIS